MPEELEVDTERLHDTIHERVAEEGGFLLRSVALSTALFAAFAAVTSLQANATVNDALLLKTEATRDQAQASDQWAFYQAKGIKAAVVEASRSAWLASGAKAPADLEQTAARYAREQEAIQKDARDKERERDAKSAEADRLLERHRHFAYAVALFQIAIALGAVAALTRMRLVWFGSIVVGFSAAALSLWQWIH